MGPRYTVLPQTNNLFTQLHQSGRSRERPYWKNNNKLTTTTILFCVMSLAITLA